MSAVLTPAGPQWAHSGKRIDSNLYGGVPQTRRRLSHALYSCWALLDHPDALLPKTPAATLRRISTLDAFTPPLATTGGKTCLDAFGGLGWEGSLTHCALPWRGTHSTPNTGTPTCLGGGARTPFHPLLSPVHHQIRGTIFNPPGSFLIFRRGMRQSKRP